ncbi:flagellar protein FlgN [Anaerospora sp.]|uniref:flagellar protein FlgN n=1 Tax=Anaerospora sp. TaxID=1960278 RepID=UPI00289D196C|nr:flagellar protein FlgN [Anaerospora sp.]
MWDNLIALLAELSELCKGLLALSKQKREFLIAGEAQKLEAVTRQEEVLILRIGKLETQREKALQEIAAAHNLTTQGLTISQLSQMADEKIAEQIKEFQQVFSSITNELVPLNQLNTQLIQQSLNFVNYNINLLAQTQTGPTYAAKGSSGQNSPSRNFLDAKV